LFKDDRGADEHLHCRSITNVRKMEMEDKEKEASVVESDKTPTAKTVEELQAQVEQLQRALDRMTKLRQEERYGLNV